MYVWKKDVLFSRKGFPVAKISQQQPIWLAIHWMLMHTILKWGKFEVHRLLWICALECLLFGWKRQNQWQNEVPSSLLGSITCRTGWCVEGVKCVVPFKFICFCLSLLKLNFRACCSLHLLHFGFWLDMDGVNQQISCYWRLCLAESATIFGTMFASFFDNRQ